MTTQVDVLDLGVVVDAKGVLRASAEGDKLSKLLKQVSDAGPSGDDGSIRGIDIRWKMVGDTLISDIAALAKQCSALASINLTDNYIGDNGCRFLGLALAANPAIRTLILKGNRIGDSGAQALASVTSSATSLTDLDLRSNKIGRHGIQAIGGSLRTNSTLVSLNLGENFFGDEGALELAHALPYNSSLVTLGLRTNEITNAGGATLAVGVRDNHSLRHLDLVDNMITVRGSEAFCSALFQNTTLQSLDLRLNELPKKAQDGLLDAADLSFYRLEIPNSHKLAFCMALHPRLGEDSDLFTLALPEENPFKQALIDNRDGVIKRSKNDLLAFRKIALVEAAVKPEILPMSSYNEAPLGYETCFRQVLRLCINNFPRHIYFDGNEETSAREAAQINSRAASRMAGGPVSRTASGNEKPANEVATHGGGIDADAAWIDLALMTRVKHSPFKSKKAQITPVRSSGSGSGTGPLQF